MTEDKPRLQAAVAQKAFNCEDCKGQIPQGGSFFWDSERKAGPRQYSWRICTPCQAKVTGLGASKSVFAGLTGSPAPLSSLDAMHINVALLHEKIDKMAILVLNISRKSEGKSIASLLVDDPEVGQRLDDIFNEQ